jgi:hypothetical protein
MDNLGLEEATTPGAAAVDRRAMEPCGLTTLDLAGCEGPSTGLEKATNALGRDAEKWNRWVDLVLRTCNQPAVVDMAGHMLYAGRKAS